MDNTYGENLLRLLDTIEINIVDLLDRSSNNITMGELSASHTKICADIKIASDTINMLKQTVNELTIDDLKSDNISYNMDIDNIAKILECDDLDITDILKIMNNISNHRREKMITHKVEK